MKKSRKTEERLDNQLMRDIERGMRDIKEGRTYLGYCGLHYGKCKTSNRRISVCSGCHVKDCKKWYMLGKKDERNSIYKRLQKNLHDADIWNLPCKDYERLCINCQFWKVVAKACRINPQNNRRDNTKNKPCRTNSQHIKEDL